MARRLRPSQTARDPTGLAARAAIEPTCLGSSGFLGHPRLIAGPSEHVPVAVARLARSTTGLLVPS